MQTFLPYASFAHTAAVLDNKRLGKQRVETYQIYKALTIPTYGWKNHPAVRQWVGYEAALVMYGVAICAEWRARGFRDTLLEVFSAARKPTGVYPAWLGHERYHQSHRRMLLQKDLMFYATKFHDTADLLLLPAVYYWPSKEAV